MKIFSGTDVTHPAGNKYHRRMRDQPFEQREAAVRTPRHRQIAINAGHEGIMTVVFHDRC